MYDYCSGWYFGVKWVLFGVARRGDIDPRTGEESPNFRPTDPAEGPAVAEEGSSSTLQITAAPVGHDTDLPSYDPAVA